MSHRRTWLSAGIVAGLLVLLSGCALLFQGGVFSRAELFFDLNETVAEGQAYTAYAGAFPEQVKLKKRVVRVSGRLQGGNELPNRVLAEGTFTDLDTGRVRQRIRLTVKITNSGSFDAFKKIAKDIQPGSLLTVEIEPQGAPIVKNSRVTLCIDLLKKVGDARSMPSCAGSGPSNSVVGFWEGTLIGASPQGQREGNITLQVNADSTFTANSSHPLFEQVEGSWEITNGDFVAAGRDSHTDVTYIAPVSFTHMEGTVNTGSGGTGTFSIDKQ